ncbi:class I SAM-dependent methyltransferase [Actinomadura keratinilytica]|uniref:class I SAM-dependent methyltransferase n=1 Tax=Actinomadura keratinilytica TaxID=547461 RepID=UPI0031F06AFC
MAKRHDETVVREFSKQAETFGDPRLNTAYTRHLARLVDYMEPELDREDVVLEVAAGTGLVSRALAHRVRHVTALDLTPAMLEQGKREADRDGVTNVTFTRGDAADLPYLSRSFTLVVCRFALHQVADPEAVLREMARVSRPGGALFIQDVIRPEDVAADPDRIERLRDPSHNALLTRARVTELVEAAGAEVKRTETFDHVRPLAPWLEQARTPDDDAARIRKELEAELSGGPATGMRPCMVDGELCFTHTNLLVHACAP